MADTEKLILYTYDGKIMIFFSTAGPSSYSTGGFSVTINSARDITDVLVVAATGGYLAEASVSGNTLTIKAYSGAGTEVADGTDLSGVTFYGVVLTK